jgi:hypothetical protein
MARSAHSFANYEIDTVTGVVSVTFTPTITFACLSDYASALCSDPRFHPTFAEIVDLRGTESVEISPQEAMKLADEVDPFSFESRRAFVCDRQGQAHFAQMHQILRPESNTIRVFHSIDEARQWIHQGSSAARAAGA